MIVTVVEFIGSWILEKFFNMKLWDYSTLPFNIEGRVAVPVSLFWGVGCIILIKLVNPPVQNWIHDFNAITHSWGVLLILIATKSLLRPLKTLTILKLAFFCQIHVWIIFKNSS